MRIRALWQRLSPNQRIAVRWGLSLSMLVITGVLFRDQLPFIASGVEQLHDLSVGGLVLLGIGALAAMFAMSEVLYVFMCTGGVTVRRRDATALVYASNAVSASLPGGPVFSTAMQYRVMNTWGAGAAIATWFLVMSSALSTVWLVALGVFAIVFLGAQLSLVSLVITLAALGGMSCGLYWASLHPDKVKRIVRPVVGKHAAKINKHIDQLHTARMSFPVFAYVATCSLLNWLFDVVALVGAVWATTHALPGLEPTTNHTTIVGVALAFVTAKIAGTVQVTPGGLGPVEAAMMGTLVATGMTATQAFSAVFLYRLVTLVGITLLGWVTYLWVYARSARDNTAAPDRGSRSTH